jgi:acetyltransferase-like isoleucine patch superfamily enzyme
MLDLTGKLRIGDNSTIAARSIILTHTNVGYADHPLRKKYPKKIEGAKIGNCCFIVVGSIILSGIEIGDNAMVGSGSLVTRNVRANSVVFGNPAREHVKKK